MIKVSIKKTNDIIDYISIKGHAEYDEYGKDIVCSSVSSIVITSVNAITRFDIDAITCKQDEGLIEVNINKHTKEIDILLENMISLLKELEQNYKKNIKINE